MNLIEHQDNNNPQRVFQRTFSGYRKFSGSSNHALRLREQVEFGKTGSRSPMVKKSCLPKEIRPADKNHLKAVTSNP
jgi:hypothetical protein